MERSDYMKILRQKLWEKAAKEQSDFIEHLKTLSSEEIIDSAYEKVMRDDILMTFEDDYLSDKQVAELVKLDYPLDACYKEWLDTDCSHMDMLRDTIDTYSKELIEKNKKEQEHHKKNDDIER